MVRVQSALRHLDERSSWEILIAYGVGSWLVLQVSETLSSLIGLPMWMGRAVVMLLGLGLVGLVATLVARRFRISRTDLGRLASLFTLRAWVAGGVGAFTLLGLGTAAFLVLRSLGVGPFATLLAAGDLGEEPRLLVGDFTNRTDDPALGHTVRVAVQTDLSQSPSVRVVDGAAIAEALTRMELEPDAPLGADVARDLAVREGIPAFVTGEIARLGTGFVLVAQVVSAEDGTVLTSERASADDEDGLLDALGRLSRRLRERIGESYKTLRSSPSLSQVTTSSLEALKLYSLSRAEMRVSGSFALTKSTGLLREAIRIDPGFAMAYRGLAIDLANLDAEPSQIAEASRQAYERRERLTEVERYKTIAGYFHNVEIDPRRVIEAYRALLAIDPEDWPSYNNLANELKAERRYREAIELYAAALERRNHSVPRWNLRDAQLKVREFESARRTWAEAPLPKGSLWWQYGHALIEVAEGNHAAADSIFRAMAAQELDLEWRARLGLARSGLDRILGRWDSAEEHLRSFMRASSERGTPRLFLVGATELALLTARQGDRPAGMAVLDDAMARYPLDSLAEVDRPYAEIAHALAKLGETGRARDLLAALDARGNRNTMEERALAHRTRGAIAEAEDRMDEAIAAYRTWSEEDWCESCSQYDLAVVLERAGMTDSAYAQYRRAVETPNVWGGGGSMRAYYYDLAPAYLRLGELAGQMDDEAAARHWYRAFLRLWEGADAEFQATVREVAGRIVRS